MNLFNTLPKYLLIGEENVPAHILSICYLPAFYSFLPGCYYRAHCAEILFLLLKYLIVPLLSTITDGTQYQRMIIRMIGF